jgi:hypothetical protein
VAVDVSGPQGLAPLLEKVNGRALCCQLRASIGVGLVKEGVDGGPVVQEVRVRRYAGGQDSDGDPLVKPLRLLHAACNGELLRFAAKTGSQSNATTPC